MSNAVEHPKKTEGFNSFAEFYPFYLREHSNRICRGLHYVGSTLGLCIAGYALLTGEYIFLLPAIICGYLFAWIGHFFFEHNRPATFKHPLYSFLGDWVMLKDFLMGRFRRK
ncbi:DUF962 domain-containing protein [uncultured Endozoicomonas sp.]|uniref:DUF962 domain-containing protein n=1 Tax=uncultured Endozoicomonas sp. TaxID=432652 RepID=UPI002619769E|nr:DUF962 domain-containing protein [uncultured Endozoicomonas sp.]